VPLPAFVEWLIASVTVAGVGLAAWGVAYTMDALAPWRAQLLFAGGILILLGVGLFAVALLETRRAPFFLWLKTKGRAYRARRSQRVTLDLQAVSRAYAEREAVSAARRGKVQTAARRVIAAYNKLVELPPFQEIENETLAQRNARAQLRARDEDNLIGDVRRYVQSDYYYALIALDEPEREAHRTIELRLLNAQGLSDLHEPIRELYDLLFANDAKP
jgi:hypothetical protein